MNQCFEFFAALDGFDVFKVNVDEGQRRQHHGQTERKNEPETSVDFSSGLHCSAEDTPGHAALCQGEVKIC